MVGKSKEDASASFVVLGRGERGELFSGSDGVWGVVFCGDVR